MATSRNETDTATLSAVEGTRPAAPPPPAGVLGGTRAAAVAFLLLVTVPALAYALGVRAPATDNRTPTPPPSGTAVLALEEASLAQLTDHLIDALPGRAAAVRADAWLDLTLFGTSPSDDVLIGEDDWLFFVPTLDAVCRSDAEFEALAVELERAADLVARTDRQLHTVIAPDKATIYPDRLPDDPLADACGQVFGQRIRELLEPDPPPGYVPFWDELEVLRDRAGEPIYFAADTHWRTEGSAVMVRAIVDRMDPSLWPTAVPRRLPEEPFRADLTVLTGLPRTETEAPLVFDRPGITWERIRNRDIPEVPYGVPGLDVTSLSAEGGTVVPGQVTMLHDSFAYMTPPQLAPFFEELVMVRKHAPTVPWVADLLTNSQDIVFEVVERDAWRRIVEEHLAASLAAALRDDLPTRRGWLRPSGVDGWATDELRAGDVVVLPGVVAEESEEPYVLQVRTADGRVVALRSQRELQPGEELVFDTVGAGAPGSLPTGAVELRLLAPDGTPVEGPVTFAVVATR